MTLNRKNNVRIGILVVVLVENVYLYLSEGAMVQQLPFQDVDGGHFVVEECVTLLNYNGTYRKTLKSVLIRISSLQYVEQDP